MLIIRPYGRSETGYDNELRRGIRLRAKYARGEILDDDELCREGEAVLEVGKFAETRPELVVAQWISVIDKIARKPGRKPTPEQRSLRDGLGRAAFELLCKEGPFRGQESDLEPLWRSKIHPYSN